MRPWLFALAASTVGCFSPRYDNGQIQCQLVANSCPNGFHCAVDHTCWRNGLEPPPQHSGHFVFGAGGGVATPSAGDGHQATTSFGQMAGTATADGLHSVQLGVVAGTVSK